MVELTPGDFLYQSDQELFLVLIDEDDDSYTFAAHGWRNIDKERVDEYVEDEYSLIHQQQKVEQLVEEQGDDDEQEQFEKLKELFDAYEQADIVEEGPHSDFALDE